MGRLKGWAQNNWVEDGELKIEDGAPAATLPAIFHLRSSMLDYVDKPGEGCSEINSLDKTGLLLS